MWESRTKTDLVIEVWEKLDCESIGDAEILAIETVVREEYGESAVDSPMVLARQLANEGAELRHSELMRLHVKRCNDKPYAKMFRNLLDFSDFDKALNSIRGLEQLRRKFVSENDKEGLRQIKSFAIKSKDQASAHSMNRNQLDFIRLQNEEIAEWLVIWLQSPEVFENWIKLRQNSRDFKTKFESNELLEQEAF